MFACGSASLQVSLMIAGQPTPLVVGANGYGAPRSRNFM